MAMLTQSEHSVLNDDETSLDNLVEGKHHKLARSVRSGLTDRDLKPDAGTRDQLNEIVESPPTKTLDSEEQDLVWKFRFYLSNQKKVKALSFISLFQDFFRIFQDFSTLIQ